MSKANNVINVIDNYGFASATRQNRFFINTNISGWKQEYKKQTSYLTNIAGKLNSRLTWYFLTDTVSHNSNNNNNKIILTKRYRDVRNYCIFWYSSVDWLRLRELFSDFLFPSTHFHISDLSSSSSGRQIFKCLYAFWDSEKYLHLMQSKTIFQLPRSFFIFLYIFYIFNN